jgi:hypothetical protein
MRHYLKHIKLSVARRLLFNMDTIVQELAQIEITTELAFDTGLP